MLAAAVVLFAFFAQSTICSLDAPLFDYEKQQLTDDDISGLDPSVRRILDFDNDARNSSSLPKSGDCKAFPGDENWPAENDWEYFNEALGGALIPTVPIAAPCYKNWGVYNEEECTTVLNNWTNPYLQ
jgi:hypothetical protein